MLPKISILKKKLPWVPILFCVVLATGIFLRTYHFSDWLLFEIDQTYDTRIVSQAIEQGPGSLPLLGPTAGGGRALRLGPAFYYLEYLSALLFGNTPTGHALLVLLSSILALPFFYLFCRRYFGATVSIALLALFSGSVYLVLYGRFSWSPNVLPFLILFSFYALLRSVSLNEPHRDRFFLLATAAISITSQIHFNAFFTIPTITILFLLYKRPHFHARTWFMALSIIALIYSPMILNDVVTHGENIGLFLKKVSKGSSSFPLKDIFRKTTVDLQYAASGSLFVVSGIDHINGGRLDGYGFQNTTALPWRLLAIVLFLIEIAVLTLNIVREKIAERKDFLVLIALWIAIPFLYFYSLISSNFQIYPRFFLLIAPAALILLGLLLEKLRPEENRARHALLLFVVFLLLLPNLWRIQTHFSHLAEPANTQTTAETEDVFPNDKRLTLQESLAITDYLLGKQQENGYPIYIDTYHEYEPTFWYLLEKHGVSYFNNIDFDALYQEGNYFLIQYPRDGKAGIEKVFTLTEKKDFGVLTVYTLSPQPENIQTLRQAPEDRTALEQTRQIQALKTWNDVLR